MRETAGLSNEATRGISITAHLLAIVAEMFRETDPDYFKGLTGNNLRFIDIPFEYDIMVSSSFVGGKYASK